MSTSQRRASPGFPTASRPRGATPPRPGLGLALLRAALLAALALTFLRQPLAALANEIRAAGEASAPLTPARTGRLPLPAPPNPLVLAADALGTALDPRLLPLLRLASLLGLLGLAAELGLAAVTMPLQRAAAGRRGDYLRVRLPLPAGGLVPGADPVAAQDLFRALPGSLPAGGRLLGRAPWCALVLGARAGEPVEIGVLVGGDEPSRSRARAALAGLIAGLSPEALVEQHDDPLALVAEPRAVVGWRELSLALPSEYPLRLADDSAAPDLLGPLVAALRPRGAAYVEMHVALRPFGGVAGWALSRGWRGRATGLKLALEQKEDLALARDVAALETKLAGAPFEVTIRLVAVACGERAPSEVEAALDTAEAALAPYQARTASRLQRLARVARGSAGPNGGRALLTPVMNRAPRFTPPPPLLLPLRPWRDPAILTPAELAGLWHLPTPALGPLVRWLSCRELPAPPVALAEAQGPYEEVRVTVGLARRPDGSHAPVGPTLRDLRQIMHLTAGMGAGKSRLLANICAQLLPHGFTLIDGKGDDQGGSLVATVRQLVPLADEGRLVLLDPLDAEWPVGLNPLAGTDVGQPGAADLALGQVLATFARLDPETWGKAAGMQQFAQMATLLVLEGQQRPTLAHVKQALADESYRERLLERATNVEVRAFWRTTFAQLGEGQRSSRDALLRRLDMLLTAETTRALITQAAPTFDMREAIERGVIVLVPIPDMTLGGLAGAVAMLVFQAFIRAAFARGGSDATRASYPLVVDELQVLVGDGESKDVEVALTRLRSLGVPAIYAHQALAQLGELGQLMQINAANRVILQTGEPDASVYARAYAASGITASDISGQNPSEHQYATLRCADIPTGLFSMRPLPWPAPRPADAPQYDGPDWRTALPEPLDPIDPSLLRLVYGQVDAGRAVAELTALGEGDWLRVLARWDAIRLHQRAHILAHPGCIPDRLERQRWLSRLLAARPRVLAAAEYARARPGS
jgi:hypothetical protein